MILITLLSAQFLHYRTLIYMMPIPPVPFASDKYYGSKSSMHGTRNKIRGINE